MSHVIVGIDPGVTGALACLVDGELLDVEDMPTFAERRGRRIAQTVNAAEVAAILERFALSNGGRPNVVVERVHAFPGGGASSMFSFGDSFGVVRSIPVALGYPTTFVEPAEWKGAIGATSDKEASRRLATEAWPTRSEWFKRRKDADRAEAALIALWSWRLRPHAAASG